MSATFDLKTGAGSDVVLTVAPEEGATFSALLRDGETITKTGNYTISGNVITLKTAYLANLTVDEYTITVSMSKGLNPTVALEVVDTTVNSVSPITATYDLKAGAGADVVLTATLASDATISAILLDSTAITVTEDYTISSGIITLLSAYLATLAVGTYTITVSASKGVNPTVALEVVDTTV